MLTFRVDTELHLDSHDAWDVQVLLRGMPIAKLEVRREHESLAVGVSSGLSDLQAVIFEGVVGSGFWDSKGAGSLGGEESPPL